MYEGSYVGVILEHSWNISTQMCADVLTPSSPVSGSRLRSTIPDLCFKFGYRSSFPIPSSVTHLQSATLQDYSYSTIIHPRRRQHTHIVLGKCRRTGLTLVNLFSCKKVNFLLNYITYSYRLQSDCVTLSIAFSLIIVHCRLWWCPFQLLLFPIIIYTDFVC